MQYQVITAQSVTQLELFVNNEIDHGWIVTGGLAVYFVEPKEILQPKEARFLQAMIIPDKDQTLNS
jgi:hypothetical protein